ncbi:MAG: hypothetical protein WB565_17040 [Acidimicrobiales bacterium]
MRIALGVAGGVLVLFAVLVVLGAVQARQRGDAGSADEVGLVGVLLVVGGLWVIFRAVRPRRREPEDGTQTAPPTWD